MSNFVDSAHSENRELVLNKAVLKAAAILGVTQAALANVIGISTAGISRMNKGDIIIKETQKTWELAVAFIRVYRSLASIMGNDEAAMKEWISNKNKAFKNREPMEMIQDALGIGEVITYLDWARGHE